MSRGPAATRPTRATPGRSDRSSQGWRPHGGTHSAAATPSRRHPRDPRPQAGPRTSETLPRNVAQHHSARSGRTGSRSSPVSSEVPTRLRGTTRTGRTHCRVHQPPAQQESVHGADAPPTPPPGHISGPKSRHTKLASVVSSPSGDPWPGQRSPCGSTRPWKTVIEEWGGRRAPGCCRQASCCRAARGRSWPQSAGSG